MRMSEKEFKALLSKCPQIAVSVPAGTMNPGVAKYRNVKVYVYPDGYISYGEKDPAHGKPADVFDSTKEFNRWNELKLIEKAGKITELQKQTKLVIQPATKNGENLIREIAYKADFMYNDDQGRTVVEDVKPFDTKTQKYKTTKDFRIKWKLLQVKYPAYTFVIF